MRYKPKTGSIWKSRLYFINAEVIKIQSGFVYFRYISLESGTGYMIPPRLWKKYFR